jgi:hypothetical protein
MLSAILSFLGGSVFRMVWGEVSSFINKRQDHQHEIERLRVQADADAAEHARNLESMRLQSELGIKLVDAQRESIVAQGDADAFTEAMRSASKPTGYTLVDVWSGIIRPAFATIAGALWVLKLHAQAWRMDEFDIGLVAVIVGFFFADRSLRRNGK